MRDVCSQSMKVSQAQMRPVLTMSILLEARSIGELLDGPLARRNW